MSRFVILHHQPGPGSDTLRSDPLRGGEHFDWMFQCNDVLRTWATEPIESFQRPFQVRAIQLADHRLHYLDYEGEISGGRGSVKQVLTGTWTATGEEENRFSAEICWHDGQGRDQSRQVEIYRSLMPICLTDETRGDWELRLESCR